MVRIAIGADHGGFALKEEIKTAIDQNWIDVGTFSSQSCNYAEFAHGVAKKVQSHEVDVGIIICRSGIGVSITANRYENVYAALCLNKGMVESARTHNNANILCLAADYTSTDEAIEFVNLFLATPFATGTRHELRVKSIDGE